MDAVDLDTPALYVDLDTLEHNIARMQEQCRAWGVALRPLVKTHKIPVLVRQRFHAGVGLVKYEPNSATRVVVLCEPRLPVCARSEVQQR